MFLPWMIYVYGALEKPTKMSHYVVVFLRQRARLEGSMAEGGWLVQKSLVYISEFLSQTDPHMPRLWINKEDKRVIGEVPYKTFNGMPHTMSHGL